MRHRSRTPFRTFGIASEVAHVIFAFDLGVLNGSSTETAGPSRSCFAGECQFAGGVRLPAGAVVSRIELEACLPDPDAFVQFNFVRVGSPAGGGEGPVDFLTGDSTTGADTPGCSRFPADLAPPEIIDNVSNVYFVKVSAKDTGSFTAVRVYYTLQISPAPAVATFGDVPTTHPFFPFIEALAASGITSGCQSSPPLYCPDQALTRGQMAVFLSTALGLHFAP
jgi:hypothetical protein